jgi:hypothetical protein
VVRSHSACLLARAKPQRYIDQGVPEGNASRDNRNRNRIRVIRSINRWEPAAACTSTVHTGAVRDPNLVCGRVLNVVHDCQRDFANCAGLLFIISM